MENKNKIDRSELWEEIFKIVKKIPRKDVDYDATDAPSATTEIEELFIKLNTSNQAENMLDAFKNGFKAATESLVSANNHIQNKKIY